MVDLSAPPSRLAPSLFPPHPNARSRPSAVVDDTFYSLPRPRPLRSPPPLLSPYRLPEDAGHHKLSRPPCSPTKRRRGVSRNLTRSARHRHCARSDCCINTFSTPLTSFDDLPWISALSIEPEYTNPWDVADLSLLDTFIEEEQSSGLGPVRRRKTSLRLDPLGQPLAKNGDPSSPPITFPFIRRTLFAESDLMPQTPPSRVRFNPSEVAFHGVHPILPSDIGEPTRPIDIDASR